MKRPLAGGAPFKDRRATVFAGWGASVGALVLMVTLAAGVFMTAEPETGTVIGPATVVSDSTASGGSAVQFGNAPDTCANPGPPTGIPVTALKFCDSFQGTSVNTNNWNTYMTSKGANGFPWNAVTNNGTSGMGCPFNADYFLPGQISVGSGNLSLTALMQPYQGYCHTTPTTFPWISGVVTSYNHFQTDGGYIEFTMKAPAGNGLWPAVWLLPGPGANTTTDNFEIDVQEGGFLPQPVSNRLAWHAHQGSTQVGGEVDSGVDLSAGYHKYAVYWVPGQSLTWYFDGRQIGQVTSAQIAIPDEPMELIIDLSIADASASGFLSIPDANTPSPSDLRVSNVQVWQ